MPSSGHRVTALITAAGAGTRMGDGPNKLFAPVGGVPVIVRTVRAFSEHPSVDSILVITSAADKEAMARMLADAGFPDLPLVAGGATRQESVFRGLRHLNKTLQPDDLVLIQDGARCFTDRAVVDRCIVQAAATGACCAAVPLKDTIKEADRSRVVQQTPDRSRYWAVQTPQAFRFGWVLDAYAQADQSGLQATDDASLVEASGHAVTLVEGSYRNIKITTPDDLWIAEGLVSRSEE